MQYIVHTMNIPLSENDLFKTSELSLAATLLYFGYSLDHLEPLEGQRLLLIFKRTEGIDEVIQNFWADQLSTSPKRYFYILKELKSRIFEARRTSHE